MSNQGLELDWEKLAAFFYLAEAFKYYLYQTALLAFPSYSGLTLISKLGKPTIASDNKVWYVAENHKEIIAKYHMPIYYGEYIFKKNRLVFFSFGFKYP